MQDYRKLDDAEDGQVLLSLVDEDGCQVTLRLSRPVADAICARLKHEPDPPASG